MTQSPGIIDKSVRNGISMSQPWGYYIISVGWLLFNLGSSYSSSNWILHEVDTLSTTHYSHLSYLWCLSQWLWLRRISMTLTDASPITFSQAQWHRQPSPKVDNSIASAHKFPHFRVLHSCYAQLPNNEETQAHMVQFWSSSEPWSPPTHQRCFPTYN